MRYGVDTAEGKGLRHKIFAEDNDDGHSKNNGNWQEENEREFEFVVNTMTGINGSDVTATAW